MSGHPDYRVISGDDSTRWAADPEHHSVPEFELIDVPTGLRHLVDLARRWGVGDDLGREYLVSRASTGDRRALVNAVRGAEDDLERWLTSPGALAAPPSPAYVAFTCLRMAADSAATRSES